MASTLGPVADFAYRAQVDTGGSVALKVIKPFEISDVDLRCTVAHANGTVTIQRSTDGTTYTDVTNAMTCAVQDVVVRAGTIATAQATFAAGNYIKATVTNGAECIATIRINPLAITGQ